MLSVELSNETNICILGIKERENSKGRAGKTTKCSELISLQNNVRNLNRKCFFEAFGVSNMNRWFMFQLNLESKLNFVLFYFILNISHVGQKDLLDI